MSEFLSVKNVVKEYAEGRSRLRVLHGVSLHVASGEFVSVIGPSGAGKSTLLHVIGLLDSPTSGEVVLEDRNLTRLRGAAKARIRNRDVGFVFQFFHLLPDFNAVENVMMPALVGRGVLHWHMHKRRARRRAVELLERVGLKERLRHRPNQLSGGECQRVAICRALINTPRLLLLDEPTGNLDSLTGENIHELIRSLNKDEGQTVVMVTHDEAAARHAGRIVRIKDGRVEKR